MEVQINVIQGPHTWKIFQETFDLQNWLHIGPTRKASAGPVSRPSVRLDYLVTKLTGMTDLTGTDISPVMSHFP
jgi:hypothetical protein